MRRKKRGISSPTVKWNNDNCQKFQEILITRSDDRHLFETCRRNIWNIAVRFGIDPRETCVRCSISSPGHPLHTRWTEQREKAISRAHPWLIITRIGPTVADFNSECSISERAASRDTSVSSPVTTGFVLRRGNRRKLESDTEFTRR